MMNNLLKKLAFSKIIILFIISIPVYADVKETFDELSESLSQVNKEFNEIASSDIKETLTIDNSLKEMNKAFEFIQEKIQSEDTETAIKAIDFATRSLNDISTKIPKSYVSSMDNTDMSALGVEGLEEVTITTKAIGEKKKKDEAEMLTKMLDINDAGLNAFEVSKSLNSLGVDTIKVNLEIKTRKEMSSWTKKEWEEAWTGGVLTDDGEKIITEKEAKQKLDILNSQINLVDEKSALIKEKESLKQKTQIELNELQVQLENLNNQKTKSIDAILNNKSNLKNQIKNKQLEIEEVNFLIEQYNEELNKIDNRIEGINSETVKLDKIKSEISELKDASQDIEKKTLNLKNTIDANNKRILQLQGGIETRKLVARDLKTKWESWNHNTITYDGRRLFDSTLSEIANENNLSIDLESLNDQKRIEYYSKYKDSFDAVKTFRDTSNKLYVPDNLKLDGTASGFIERQKKVLDMEKNYLAWASSVNLPQEEINGKISENKSINLEISVLKEQLKQKNSLLNIKKSELSGVEANILKIDLDDPRKKKLENLELNRIDTLTKFDSDIKNLNEKIENNQIEINNKIENLSLMQSQEIEKNQRIDFLKTKLDSVKRQKNLAVVSSRKDIKKEAEAFNDFGHILVKSYGEDVADAEVYYALKQTDVILSGDAKQHELFDFEKYGTIAGLSDNLLKKGKTAIENDDLTVKKEVYSELFSKLSKNKNYDVDVPNNKELDQLITETQFENEIVELIRSNPTGINFDANAMPAVKWNKGAATPTKLKEVVENTYSEILDKANYSEKIGQLNDLKNDAKQKREWLNQAQRTMTAEGLWSNQEILSEYDKNYMSYSNTQKNVIDLSYELSTLQSSAATEAKDIVWQENNQIVQARAKAVDELNDLIDDKLTSISNYNPEKINRLRNVVSKLDANSGWLQSNYTSDRIAAEAKAALYDDDGTMLKAFHIANDTLTKSFYGITTDKTNVEIAAQIQSTLDGTYGTNDINGYMTAKYGQGSVIDKIERFSVQEKREVEKELSKLFSEKDSTALKEIEQKFNSDLKAINNQIQITTKEKNQIAQNINQIEKQISQISISGEKLKEKIETLNKEISSKEVLFEEKKMEITENINQISAIDFQIANLQEQRQNVENKINTKLKEADSVLKQVSKNQNEIVNLDKEILNKKAEFDSQINQLEEARKPLLDSANLLSNEIKDLNNQVEELEKSKPIYEKQISVLEEEIDKLNNTKADLATAQAKNMGLDVDEKVVKSIPRAKNKAIITLNGPSLVRVIDDKMLTQDAEAFKDPISKFSANTRVFTAAAVKPEELFAVKNVSGEIMISLSEGTVKEINTGSLGIKIDDVKSAKNSMKKAKSELNKTKKSLKSVKASASSLSSITEEEMEISTNFYSDEEVKKLAPGTSISYDGFNNIATQKSSMAVASASKAAASSRAAADKAAQAAKSAQDSAKQAAEQAAKSASRQAAEAAAMQAAQAAAAQQAQRAATKAAAQASAKAASVASKAAATNMTIATSGSSKAASLQSAAKAAKQNATEMTNKANAAAATAAQEGATQAQKDAAAAAEAAAQQAGNAKRAAEAAAKATHNAVSAASVAAKAAAEQAAKEAAQAAAVAAKAAADQAAQQAAAAAAQAAKDAAVSSIQSRIAELESALATVATDQQIYEAADYGARKAFESRDCGGPCHGVDNFMKQHMEGGKRAREHWKDEIEKEKQKLSEAQGN